MHEWVLVVNGAARLRFEDEEAVVEMTAASYVSIPAHHRHRVDWTDPQQPTIWLAIHYSSPNMPVGNVPVRRHNLKVQDDCEETMAVERAKYEVVNSLPDMCASLIAEHPDRYGHLDTTLLRMAVVTNREPPADGPFFKVIRVSEPLATFSPFRYVVVTWHPVWDQIGENGRNLLISDVLDYLCAQT